MKTFLIILLLAVKIGFAQEHKSITKIKAEVLKAAENDEFSGAILIAKGKDILYSEAYGLASKRFDVPNLLTTKFNLASMGKMFTGVGILQLVEQNKIKLDDPIGKYLDDSWLNSAYLDDITIHHLLSHTSGLGSYFNKEFWLSSRAEFRTMEAFKTITKKDTLQATPGTSYHYSNNGILLLGVVIEKVSEMSYFEYVKKNIFDPCAMKSTGFDEMDHPVHGVAIGYSKAKNPTKYENNLFKNVIKGGPAGGGFSTVTDLHNFALSMIDNSLISATSLALMLTDHIKANYGYCFDVNENKNGLDYGHSGGFPGVSTQFKILGNGAIVIVLSNYDSVPFTDKVIKLSKKL